MQLSDSSKAYFAIKLRLQLKVCKLIEICNYLYLYVSSITRSSFSVSYISEMPAPKILSEGQWNIMLDYMEANPIFAKGNIANMSRHEAKEENNLRWKRLANRLNSVGSGCIKNFIKWREVSKYLGMFICYKLKTISTSSL